MTTTSDPRPRRAGHGGRPVALGLALVLVLSMWTALAHARPAGQRATTVSAQVSSLLYGRYGLRVTRAFSPTWFGAVRLGLRRDRGDADWELLSGQNVEVQALRAIAGRFERGVRLGAGLRVGRLFGRGVAQVETRVFEARAHGFVGLRHTNQSGVTLSADLGGGVCHARGRSTSDVDEVEIRQTRGCLFMDFGIGVAF